MIVYLDTSAILRHLLHEPDAIHDWGTWTEAYSSRLWRTEALRAVHRLRLDSAITDQDVAELQSDIALIDETLHIIPVSESILTRAGEAFPTNLGTLDAIHLASALLIHNQNPLNRFLTHDRQQATTAASLGLAVEGI